MPCAPSFERRISALLLLAPAALLAGCEADTTSVTPLPPAVHEVRVSPSFLSLTALGATATVTAEAVDSTGAGDSFAGGFLAYWVETGDVDLSARRAATVAAGCVSGYGAVDPIPRRAQADRTARPCARFPPCRYEPTTGAPR